MELSGIRKPKYEGLHVDWLRRLLETHDRGETLTLHEEPLPGRGRVLSLAPHPDDPEAIAATLYLLASGGWDLRWVVVTSGWSGVLEDFVGPEIEARARARQIEQRAAARAFGLPASSLTFLRLQETDAGELKETDTNRTRLFQFLDAQDPDLVLMPSGQDPNYTHRRTASWFIEWANARNSRAVCLWNEDPKTTGFRADLQVVFGEETAAWKSELLECHRSQSQRNQATRGITFAERILGLNRAVPGLAPGQYAERFQLVRSGR